MTIEKHFTVLWCTSICAFWLSYFYDSRERKNKFKSFLKFFYFEMLLNTKHKITKSLLNSIEIALQWPETEMIIKAKGKS